MDNQENKIQNNDAENESIMNSSISLHEVRQAMKLRNGKSTGYDEILAEVLCYDLCLVFLNNFSASVLKDVLCHHNEVSRSSTPYRNQTVQTIAILPDIVALLRALH